MALIHLTRGTADLFRARFAALKPDSPRQFGTLEPAAMLCHLRCAVGISLGEVQLPDQSNILSRTLFRFMVFYVVPWPKGKIKAPPAFTPPPENDFAVERDLLLSAVDRFTGLAEREPEKMARHPLFGAMTMTYWSRVHGMHFNHHLEQFGV